MSKRKGQDLIYGTNYEKFNTLKQQLEYENQLLLKQRQKIEGRNQGYQTFPSQNTIIEKNQLQFEEDEDQENVQLPHFETNQKYNLTNQKKSLRQQINLRGQPLSDDIMEMIDQIQNKALLQIESLRRDKIALLKKLNKQIKIHNNQKIQRIGYEKKSNNLTQQLKKEKRKAPQRIEKNIPNTIYQQEDQNSPSPQASYKPSRRIDQPIQYQNQQQNNFQRQQQVYQPQPQRQTAQSGSTQNPYPQQEPIQHINQQRPQSQPIQPNFQPTPLARSQRPAQINNQNIVPSQSFYYVGKNPQASNVNQQQQNIQNEMNRLRQQNLQMRNTLTRHNSQTVFANNKNVLKNQLRDLESRAQHYQQLLTKARSNQSTDQRFDEIQTLLLQSANIAQNGERLMKVKSNPQFKRNIQTQIINQPYRNSRAQFTQVQSNTRIQRQAETPISYSKNTRNYNQNSNKFSPGDYERIIQNMKRAAYS